MSKNKPEMARQVTVVETGPFDTRALRQYLLASEAERESWQRLYPNLIVRLATEAEQKQLQGRLTEGQEVAMEYFNKLSDGMKSMILAEE